MRKSVTVQNHQQTLSNLQKSMSPSPSQHTTGSSSKDADTNATSPDTTNNELLNVLLDPQILVDYPTQALVLTVLATLVRNSSDENEIRVLYAYIAEASIVFPKVFPVIHNLLDSKINQILQLSMDESILNSVQSIIQNMIYSCSAEYYESNQQQLSYLQSCGFGGLWRFAQPFAVGREKPENVELFIDCLEAMVETCLPLDNTIDNNNTTTTNNPNTSTTTPPTTNTIASNCANNSHFTGDTTTNSTTSPTTTNVANSNASLFHLPSTSNLITGSMSSISMGSLHQLDCELDDLNEANLSGHHPHHSHHHHHHHHHQLHRARTNSIRRNSSPRNTLF